MQKGHRGGRVKDYQELVCYSLRQIFGESEVKIEWDVAKDREDDFTRDLYCPRLDIALGPFNIDRNIDHNKSEIENALQYHRDFIRRLIHSSQHSHDNIDEFLDKRNKNPRCFLAIEIENSGSSKHMLGNIANVSIIGSLGIVIPFNDKQLSLCMRIKEYVSFASSVKKVKAIFENVLVIDRKKFLFVLAGNNDGTDKIKK